MLVQMREDASLSSSKLRARMLNPTRSYFIYFDGCQRGINPHATIWSAVFKHLDKGLTFMPIPCYGRAFSFLFFFLYFDGYTNVVCMNEWMSCFADRQKHMEAMDNDLII